MRSILLSSLLAIFLIGCGSGSSKDAVIVDTYVNAEGKTCFYLEPEHSNQGQTGVYCKE